MQETALDQRFERLERTVKRQRLALAMLGLGGGAALLASSW